MPMRPKPKRPSKKSQLKSFKDSQKISRNQIIMEKSKLTAVKNNYHVISFEDLNSKFSHQISNVQISNGKYCIKNNENLLKRSPKFAMKEKVSSDVEMEKKETEIFKMSSKTSRKRCYEDAMISTRYDFFQSLMTMYNRDSLVVPNQSTGTKSGLYFQAILETSS